MGQKVILVVDDIEDVRQAIIRTLGEDKYSFLEASSGEEAFDIINDNSIDLVLSDIAMPKGNGLELLEKLKGHSNPPKFILVTGYASMFPENPEGLKASAIIEKPYRATDLIHLVEEILSKE